MVTSSDIKKIFGTNVKKARVAKGLTQEQLAEILDLQVQTITFIETGRTFISSEVLAKLCNYFNVEISYFFKSRNLEPTEKQINLKREINRSLSDCSEEVLSSIYSIVTALKK